VQYRRYFDHRGVEDSRARPWLLTRKSIVRLAWLTAICLTVFLLVRDATRIWPRPTNGEVPGFVPDTPDYVQGAQAILRGEYVVDWDWGVPHVPRYPPGFSMLLAPAVAIGGPDATVFVSFAAALAIGMAAAAIAARLSGPLAAPLAVFLVLYVKGSRDLAVVVMSDLPAAAILVVEVALLVYARRARHYVVAGIVAGALVWIRLPLLALTLAGLVSLSAVRTSRRAAAWYLCGAVPLIMLLGLWQFVTFGSPFVSSYQAAGAAPDGSTNIGALFSLQYALGEPWNEPWRYTGPLDKLADWGLPNALLYPLLLLGADGYLLRPGVGLVGLVALAGLALQRGSAGVFGRFGLTAVAATLAVYVPYFYQDARFIIAPAALLAIGAAALAVRCVTWAVERVHGRYGSTLRASTVGSSE
jgi:hypothetical protein